MLYDVKSGKAQERASCEYDKTAFQLCAINTIGQTNGVNGDVIPVSFITLTGNISESESSDWMTTQTFLVPRLSDDWYLNKLIISSSAS